jgi:hypothetical protein
MTKQDLWHIPKNTQLNINSREFPLQISNLEQSLPKKLDFRRTKGFCQKFLDSEYKSKIYFGGNMFKIDSILVQDKDYRLSPLKKNQSSHDKLK